MRSFRTGLILAALAVMLLVPDISAGRNEHSSKPNSATKNNDDKSNDSKSKLKSYDSLIEDMVAIEGLFTFYLDTTDNTMLMSIKPEQLDEVMLCGLSLSRGDGAFVEGQRMFGTFPFYFKRTGKKIMFMEKNLRVRVDSTNTMRKAVEAGISDALFSSTSIKSKPQDSTNAILVDPSGFFVRDALHISYFLGQRGKTGISFDKSNSFFGEVKSFPENSEINVNLHYKTSKPQSAIALQNNYSFFHTLHYSLSSIPESDYRPRIADERIGHFHTIYQDYNRLDTETPYVRFIERWDLKKKNPGARISEAIEPIVFWVENTVPEQYRDAIAEGIEFWNQSFQKIGFRNAIQAKQMPDTADWDPADVRYSTVRWLVATNYPYRAIGPSRSNPYTGEVYDADIGFVANAIRSLYRDFETQVYPYTISDNGFDEVNETGEHLFPWNNPENPHSCQIFSDASDLAMTSAYINSVRDIYDQDSLLQEYIHSFIVFVIAHEVGHTLGFKHNFIASSIYSLEDINNPEFTLKNSAVGTVMDYPAANMAPVGEPQGEFYPSVTGPYDDWIIEYSYSDFDDITEEEEAERLNAIAAQSASDARLLYASDEDTYGTSIKSIDPRTNIWDSGDDPIAYVELRLAQTDELWNNSIKKFEKDGGKYQRMRSVFNAGFFAFNRAASILPKYVGGLYHSRQRIGNERGVLPYEVVPAAEQRRAVKLLSTSLFAADAFDIPADLLNKLQVENMSDFTGSVYRRLQVDYPIHKIALNYQNRALARLYHPLVLNRLIDNLSRVPDGGDKYTMYEFFEDMRDGIWSEVINSQNVNSYRRQLQLSHMARLIMIFMSNSASFPADARALAGNELDILKSAASKGIKSTSLNGMTKAHNKEIIRQIEGAQSAQRPYLGF